MTTPAARRKEALTLKIEGGHKLSGSVITNSAKNSAVVLLCASLLNRGTTRLKNMPRIEEVYRIIEVLRSIGVRVSWQGSDVLIAPPARLTLSTLDVEAAMRTRSIVMLLAPLAHHLPRFSLPHPGGCKLGKRTVRPHLYALERLGIHIVTTKDRYVVFAKRLHPAHLVLYESGDTVTANALMAAAMIPKTTTIKFASANYQVQDLCLYLQQLGATIHGIGTTTLVVRGVRASSASITCYLTPDPIESMLFISLAVTTKSKLTIKRCPIDFLELELLKLEKMGLRIKQGKEYRAPNGVTKLVDITVYPSRLRALEEKLYARPFPGLNIDNLPFFVPIATQAKGTTLIHDWVYENRALYYMELTKLGAEMILADPHRVYVEGPSELIGSEIVCPPALRPAAIILIAMLAARGTSILRNIYSISRGYEDLVRRLRKLGARISPLRSV